MLLTVEMAETGETAETAEAVAMVGVAEMAAVSDQARGDTYLATFTCCMMFRFVMFALAADFTFALRKTKRD